MGDVVAAHFVVHSVEYHPFAVIGAAAHGATLGPDAAGRVAAHVLAPSCIDDVDEVHIAVVVHVILGEVHTGLVGQTAHLGHKLAHIVRAFSLSIYGVALAEGDRAVDVELRIECPSAHVGEILLHAAVVFAHRAIFRTDAACSVEILFEDGLGVELRRLSVDGFGGMEGHVGKLCQDDQHPWTGRCFPGIARIRALDA